jgi:hypothetical protein
MSKKQSATQADTTGSPYLSFREALRPAIFAHRLLLQEGTQAAARARLGKEGAGMLAQTASDILALTRDLLSKAGLGYTVSPDSRTKALAGDGLGYQGSITQAFADAAMMWSQIVGNCLLLAEELVSQGRLDEVRSLAVALADCGETGTAEELGRRLGRTIRQKYEDSLESIHGSMTPEEIDTALATLTEAISEVPQSPERDIWIMGFLPALAKSVSKYVKPRGASNPYSPESKARTTLENIASGGPHGHNLAQTYASLIAGTFRTFRPRNQ